MASDMKVALVLTVKDETDGRPAEGARPRHAFFKDITNNRVNLEREAASIGTAFNRLGGFALSAPVGGWRCHRRGRAWADEPGQVVCRDRHRPGDDAVHGSQAGSQLGRRTMGPATSRLASAWRR